MQKVKIYFDVEKYQDVEFKAGSIAEAKALFSEFKRGKNYIYNYFDIPYEYKMKIQKIELLTQHLIFILETNYISDLTNELNKDSSFRSKFRFDNSFYKTINMLKGKKYLFKNSELNLEQIPFAHYDKLISFLEHMIERNFWFKL